MDTTTLAALRRSLTTAASRRGALSGLGAGLLAARLFVIGSEDAEARKSGKRNKKRKNKNKNKNKRHKAKTRIDATCPGAGESGVTHLAGDVRVAQSFTAIRSGLLVKATLPITNVSDTAGDFVLSLSPVDGSGLPTDEVLAESTITVDAAPDEVVELEFAFADPFSVEAGIDYALVLTRPDGDDFIWRGNVGESCGGIVSVSIEQGSPFQPAGDEFDLIFTSFVKS